jgi:predicted SnoaL-like aldol condensation-catalyzing enzyme
MSQNLEANKKNAVAFYQMAFDGNPKQAAELYIGAHYIQHNPLVKDGIDGFVEYFDRMYVEYPEKSIRFLRVIAEDDLVALHTHQIWPNEEEHVTMDFMRFDENGKIVEHWDAMQEVPKEAVHDNTMF